jgi:hypothetical protein
MRPTSRQRMQRLADELAAEGLVEFVDNPRHRRSKLVRLTRKGDVRYRELSARLLAIASMMGAELSEADVRKTTETVRRLSDEAKELPERLPRSTMPAAPASASTLSTPEYLPRRASPAARATPATRGSRPRRE